MLLTCFNKKYQTVLQAKIIVDPVSRYSKGYGFVKFGSHEEAQKAITEMQGKYLLSKPMKLNYAAQKKNEGGGGGAPNMGGMNPMGGYN